MNTYIVNEIRKKWWQIILIGIICAIVIIISRTVISKPVMVHGPINTSIIFIFHQALFHDKVLLKYPLDQNYR